MRNSVSDLTEAMRGQFGHYSKTCMYLMNIQRGAALSANNKPNGSVENECRFCHEKNLHLSINCPDKPMLQEQMQKKGNHCYLQNPNQVPGMTPGLI